MLASFRWRRRVSAFVLIVSMVSMMPVASAQEAPESEPVRDLEFIPTRPVLGSVDNPLLASLIEGGGRSGGDPDIVVEGDGVVVEIVHGLDEDGVAALVSEVGGAIRGSVLGLALAEVPLAALGDLASNPDVMEVRPPLEVSEPAVPLAPGAGLLAAIRGAQLDLTNASAWHALGLTGTGVRIGIIDYFDSTLWSSAQVAGDLPAPAGTYSTRLGVESFAFPDDNSGHGVAVAEIIHEMAPSAQIYIATAFSTTDLAAVVDYFDSVGVSVISRSLGSVYDGPGDGTGFIDEIVDDAVARGMLWVNSAGNSAGRNGRRGQHLRVTYADADGDGWVDFAPGVEVVELEWATCFFGGFRWSDWGDADPTDYDMYFFEDAEDLASGTWEARLLGDQTSGGKPLETMVTRAAEDPNPCGTDPNQRDVDYVAIRVYDAGSGLSGDVLQFTGGFFLDLWSNTYSATQPAADSKSPGAIAAAAMEPFNGTFISDYSSEGPTNDDRTKPDLATAVCIGGTTAISEGYQCQGGTSIGFSGTSAAAPVIAGAAALVIDAGVASSPAAIRSYLLSEASVDRGAAGVDNLFGSGQLTLPTSPLSAPQWGRASLDVDGGERSVRLSWPAVSDPDGIAGYLIYQAPGVPVDGFYRGSRIADVSGGTFHYTAAGLSPDTAYAFWVEVYDTGGAVSVDGPLRVVRTAVDYGDTNGHLFESDIAWLSSARITSGCNPPEDDRFCPDVAVTRAQMATFLVRAAGLHGSVAARFADTTDSVHRTDIDLLAAAGITEGCTRSADRFCPDDTVTRAQMASFLVRALGLAGGGHADYFNDDDSSVHEADINRLAQAGITVGCSEGSFCPEGTVTRGQMAAFLRRAQDHFDVVRAGDGLQPLSSVGDVAASIPRLLVDDPSLLVP